MRLVPMETKMHHALNLLKICWEFRLGCVFERSVTMFHVATDACTQIVKHENKSLQALKSSVF